MPPRIPPLLFLGNPDTIDSRLLQTLQAAGFSAVVAPDITSAQSYVNEHGLPAALIINLLDLGQQGLKFCQKMTVYAGLPVILIISSQGQEIASIVEMLECSDIVLRLEEASSQELVARLKRLFARIQSFTYAARRKVPLSEEVTADLVDRTITVKRDKHALTPIEAALLHVLLVHRGEMVDSQTLMDRVWRSGAGGNANALRVHMHRLRRKLENEDLIQTIRDIGYRLSV